MGFGVGVGVRCRARQRDGAIEYMQEHACSAALERNSSGALRSMVMSRRSRPPRMRPSLYAASASKASCLSAVAASIFALQSCFCSVCR